MSGSALIIDDHPLYRDVLQQVLSGIWAMATRSRATSRKKACASSMPRPS